MGWLPSLLIAIALVLSAGCGGDAQIRQYPDTQGERERKTTGSESDAVRRSTAPPRSGGPHPTDDEVTGERINPL